jgi:hypothetical protein
MSRLRRSAHAAAPVDGAERVQLALDVLAWMVEACRVATTGCSVLESRLQNLKRFVAVFFSGFFEAAHIDNNATNLPVETGNNYH